MKKFAQKKGFSITEVLISITLIVLVIVSATTLLISSNRANVTNINQIIAYNLAQEALEGFRNIRDGYWLHNQPWKGEKELLGDDFNTDGYYVISKRPKNKLLTPERCTPVTRELNEPVTVKTHAPWELKKIQTDNPSEVSETILYIYPVGDVMKYSHELFWGEESRFRRWLEIQTIPYELASGTKKTELKIAVTAVVEWEEQTRMKTVRVPTILTDWKAGPL